MIILGMVGYYAKQISVYYEKGLEYITSHSNFNLQKIYVKNNHLVSGEEIGMALDVKLGQSIYLLHLDKIKTRLEQISWVKSAIVTRRLPNTLAVDITERAPIAFWQNDKKLYLLDDEGVLIIEKNLKPFKDLIILIGEDAPLNAASFIKMLSKDEGLYKKISSATRIGERRWNVKFYGGLEIKLPEKNMQAAWDYVINLYKKKNLFASNVTTIDLRIENKLYVK
jgi:cell division protein FtsQ